jgi:hypothetical protein
MANQITIVNAERNDFMLHIDGSAVPQLQGSVLAGSINVVPGAGHSIVYLGLIATHVAIEHDAHGNRCGAPLENSNDDEGPAA